MQIKNPLHIYKKIPPGASIKMFEGLKQKITQEAQAKAKEIIHEAEQEAARIKQEAENKLAEANMIKKELEKQKQLYETLVEQIERKKQNLKIDREAIEKKIGRYNHFFYSIKRIVFSEKKFKYDLRGRLKKL